MRDIKSGVSRSAVSFSPKIVRRTWSCAIQALSGRNRSQSERATVLLPDPALPRSQINDDRARVASDVQRLEIKKAELDGAVARLEAMEHVRGLSREQVPDELRKRGELRD